jgi:exosortase A
MRSQSGGGSGMRRDAETLGASATVGALAAYAPVFWALLAALGVLAVYGGTAASIVSIWYRSETFAHGYVVIPISLWLAWRMRAELERTPAIPWWPGLLAVAAAGTAWFVSDAADVLGAKQFALAFIVLAAIITVVGKRVARVAAFPLAFLLFAVPVGEIFVPTLIEWTANFTVAALRASGVPVYREANYFVIPSGAWSVVEACSGIRYLIASLMVGTLYAHLMYRTRLRRAAFIAAALFVPIVANWLRAYMIVMIGHLSNNQLAVGVDHIIYGWVFFGLVMLLLYWIGSMWQEPEAIVAPVARIGAIRDAPVHRRSLAIAAMASIAVAAPFAPLSAMVTRSIQASQVSLAPIEAAQGWTATAKPVGTWRPRYSGYVAELAQGFEKNGDSVGLYLAFYRDQKKGRELVTSSNQLVHKMDEHWREGEQVADRVEWSGRDVEAVRTELLGVRPLMVYSLFWVDGRLTGSPYVAKALLAWSRLTGNGDDCALIVWYADRRGDPAAVRAVLADFAATMSPSIEHLLARARVPAP